MSETTSSEIETAIPEAGNAITNIVVGLAGTITQAMQDPCSSSAVLLDKVGFVERELQIMLDGVIIWSNQNRAAVRDSIRDWGKFQPFISDYARSVPFADYLVNNGYIELIFHGPVTMVLKRGEGDVRPSTKNRGILSLGRPNAYLQEDGEGNLVIGGSNIAQAWDDWIEQQTERVYSAASGRPEWRNRLRAWTGYSDWKPGDRYSKNSTIGNSIARVNRIRAAYTQAAEDCETQRDLQAELAKEGAAQQRTWIENQLAKDLATLDTEIQTLEEEEKTKRQTAIAASVAVAAVALAVAIR